VDTEWGLFPRRERWLEYGTRNMPPSSRMSQNVPFTKVLTQHDRSKGK
jgi:hypothetical protein